jgi:hypothetical protein
MARYEQSMEKHGDEKKAASQADTAVAESVGSGADLHLGGVFQSNNTEFIRTFTLFGSWFNAYYQRAYRNTKGMTTIANGDAIKSLLFTPFVVAGLSAALILDGPEDDDDFMTWALKQYGYFMGGTVPLLRDVVSFTKGFKPTTVYASGVTAPVQVAKELMSLSDERQTGLKTLSDVTKAITGVVPVPGTGNMTRLMDYMDSYNLGNEGGDFNLFQGVVEGPDRNK